ncbi:MAG: glycosyltransferase family 2 protein [Porphyromonadaceae bacterium]|nr:glycosyltransferase family 2 protein [Porphyromonadaceae bacterium]
MLVSIIIPMYGVEPVLPQCLDCLLGQTYKHLEIIFVDDCSPDRSSQLVSKRQGELEEQGYRVKLIKHQQNGGVAMARNTGIDAAEGEYIYYFDADDRLEPDAIDLMVGEARRTDADIVGIDWSLSYEGKERRMHQPLVTQGIEAFRYMCYGSFKWNLWLFLVRRELYERGGRKRFLPGQNMGEDMMLMGKLFLKARHVTILPQVLYHYVKTNADSLTANYTDKHWGQVDANLQELEQYVLANRVDDGVRCIALLKLNLKLPLLISPRQSDYDRWAGWFTEANPYIMSNPVLPLRTRLLQKVAAHGQWWLVRLYYELIMRVLYSIFYK